MIEKDVLCEFADETADVIKKIADHVDSLSTQNRVYRNALSLYMIKYGNFETFAKDVIDKVNELASNGYAFRVTESGLKDDGSFDIHFHVISPEDQNRGNK